MTFEFLSVVVPCYNSEASLPLLLERLLPVLEAEASRAEVILVNDDSRDGTWDAITRLAGIYPAVHGINLMRNYGQHNALLCGIRAAQGDVVITMDDDLQHPPEEIPNLLAKLGDGYDVVYGTPQQEQHGLWRDMASQLTKLALQSAMGTDIARSVSAFRVFRTALRDAFKDYSSPNVNIDVLLTWATKRFTAMPVRHEARTIGVSNYTFKKLLTHAVNMITGFSVLPLQLASYVGFGTMLFGIIIFIYVLVRYAINGGSVPGFPFLASMIAIFSGVQLFVVGIFGEYLARVYQRTMNRPIYTVREEVGVYEVERL
ncbi:glycosyltransferase family 2 protein [Aggregatilinea lenta]|uniref:glycosyltransferase family 2 protein n=1 Tax=Aggregatilinea lenta TaxID=913108 RepID=UPI000E5B9D90|nr:glycosyltransferase family 2 protein [Aggregatilinea lenta]